MFPVRTLAALVAAYVAGTWVIAFLVSLASGLDLWAVLRLPFLLMVPMGAVTVALGAVVVFFVGRDGIRGPLHYVIALALVPLAARVVLRLILGEPVAANLLDSPVYLLSLILGGAASGLVFWWVYQWGEAR